ncbi:hypothetical protein C5167_013834, partial [Papaver somniferum]
WPTLEQRLANPPKNVVESQWRVLVDVWENDAKKKEISEKNKQNRSKQKNLHTTGSRPHANYAVEELGRPPKRCELYGVTHTRKKKTEDPDEVLIDPEVAAKIKYWGEESSSQATNDLNVENVNFRQQLEITIGDLQAAMKRISELEAQLATRDETGTANGHLQEALKKIAELEEEVESLKMVQDFRIGDMLRT